MSSFKGSLRIDATADVIDAVFDVDGNHLTVTTGGEQLGSWSLHDLEPDDTGTEVLLALDGERVAVNAIDHIAFSAALAPTKSRRRSRPAKTKRHVKTKQSRRQEKAEARRPVPDRPKANKVMLQQPKEEPPQLEQPSPEQPSLDEPMLQPKPKRPRQEKQKRSRPSRDLMGSVRRALNKDTWVDWAAEGTVLWVVASVAVIIVALLAVFATNSLGMILVLLGMVALIIAALAVSEDLSAYSWIPGNLSEVTLVIIGASAMGVGGLLIVIS